MGLVSSERRVNIVPPQAGLCRPSPGEAFPERESLRKVQKSPPERQLQFLERFVECRWVDP